MHLEMRAVEECRFGSVSSARHGPRWIAVVSHAMPLEKGLQLLVSAFEHGQDLGVGPGVHGYGSHKGRLDPIGSMAAAALDTQQDTIGNAGPLGLGVSTIDAETVSRKRVHHGPTCWREVGPVMKGNTSQRIEFGGHS